MTEPIRRCYFPRTGCPDNKGEECYADLYPYRLTCEIHDSKVKETKENV